MSIRGSDLAVHSHRPGLVCYSSSLCVAIGGRLTYPRSGFLTMVSKLLGILWNAAMTYPRNILAAEANIIFPMSVTVPQI